MLMIPKNLHIYARETSLDILDILLVQNNYGCLDKDLHLEMSKDWKMLQQFLCGSLTNNLIMDAIFTAICDTFVQLFLPMRMLLDARLIIGWVLSCRYCCGCFCAYLNTLSARLGLGSWNCEKSGVIRWRQSTDQVKRCTPGFSNTKKRGERIFLSVRDLIFVQWRGVSSLCGTWFHTWVLLSVVLYTSFSLFFRALLVPSPRLPSSLSVSLSQSNWPSAMEC